MTEDDFHVLQHLLKSHDLIVTNAHYDRSTFGSWEVQVTTSPPLRVLWDGKERWLILQQESEQVFAGARVWKDLWIAEAKSQTPEAAIGAVLSRLGAA